MEEHNSEINKAENQPSVKNPVEFTEITGGYGKWQRNVVFMNIIFGGLLSTNIFCMSFLAYPQDHWCSRPEDGNISLKTWWAEFLPNTTIFGKVQHSQCEMFVFNVSAEPIVPSNSALQQDIQLTNLSAEYLNLSLTQRCKSWEYTTDFNSIVKQWHLVCDREWMVATCQTAYMVAFFLANSFCSQLADIYGRYPVMVGTTFIIITAGSTAIFSTSFEMFLICRFLIGFGYSGFDVVLYTHLIECLGPQYRTKCTFICHIGWHLGYVLLPLVAWILSDWFYLQVYITAPSLFLILFYWHITESPRWLLSQGNVEKAIPIIKSAAEQNRKKVNNIEEDVKKICSVEYEAKEKQPNITFIDLLRTSNLRKEMFGLYVIWISTSFSYYGLSLNTNDLDGNHYLNFFLSALVEIPGTIFAALTLDRYGRKNFFTSVLLSSGLACVTCIAIPESLSIIETTLAMISKLFTWASLISLFMYSAEIFPTVARSVGLGSCLTVSRIGSIMAPFMTDFAKMTYEAVPLTLYGAVLIISSFIVYKLPETAREIVPETINQAENFGKQQQLSVVETERPAIYYISSEANHLKKNASH